jgi:hypothetical protein
MSTEPYDIFRSLKLISYTNIELHIELDSVFLGSWYSSHCLKIIRKKTINTTFTLQFRELQLEVPSQV